MGGVDGVEGLGTYVPYLVSTTAYSSGKDSQLQIAGVLGIIFHLGLWTAFLVCEFSLLNNEFNYGPWEVETHLMKQISTASLWTGLVPFITIVLIWFLHIVGLEFSPVVPSFVTVILKSCLLTSLLFTMTLLIAEVVPRAVAGTLNSGTMKTATDLLIGLLVVKSALLVFTNVNHQEKAAKTFMKGYM